MKALLRRAGKRKKPNRRPAYPHAMPFAGIRILDLTKVFSGPFCTRLFADYGAEVIKIESHAHPDDSRQYPPFENGWSGYYEMLNRNKRGIAIDLKSERGRVRFLKLSETADVIVENFTPETKHDLGIGYESVYTVNPRIIYASVSGTGQTNSRRYYDILAQAESGLMTVSGTPGHPVKIGPSVVDAFAGMTLAWAIAGALFQRSITGKGTAIDVSMLGAALHMLESNLTQASMTGKNPQPAGNQDSMIAPFGIYKARDGFVAVAAGNDAQWLKLKAFLSRYSPVPPGKYRTNAMRIRDNAGLTRVMERALSGIPAADAVRKLQGLGIPAAPVRTMTDVLRDRALYESGELVRVRGGRLGGHTEPGFPVRFGTRAAGTRKPAPDIGEHTLQYED